MDVILATATKPITVPPRAHSVAAAWLSQSGGYERYFLENVRHGILTFDDVELWQRIEKRAPHWLTSEDYAQAITSEEHTSELQSIMRNQVAACGLEEKTKHTHQQTQT